MLKEMRNKLAIERDKWFESAEGKKCLDAKTLGSEVSAEYLKNRLEFAFLAGAAVNAIPKQEPHPAYALDSQSSKKRKVFWYPTNESLWIAHCPEQGSEFFATEDEAIDCANEMIRSHLDEGWSENVDQVYVAKAVYLTRQCDLETKPPSDQIHENGFDSDGRNWREFEYYCNYQLEPAPEQPESKPEPACPATEHQ